MILDQKDKKIFVSTLLLVVLHVVGLAGLSSSRHDVFLQLVPINLLLSAVLLFINHKEFNSGFYTFCFVTILAGFFIEVMGVKTGFIFGEYRYGTTLGFKIMNVPLIIGLNWLILVYCTGIICDKINTGILIKSMLGALMMVLIDFFIEPIAVKYNFWSWRTSTIPIQNYSSWFIVSFVLLYIFYRSSFKKDNKMARILYIIQLVFFILLGII